jgi:hypothetical protein
MLVGKKYHYNRLQCVMLSTQFGVSICKNWNCSAKLKYIGKWSELNVFLTVILGDICALSYAAISNASPITVGRGGSWRRLKFWGP